MSRQPTLKQLKYLCAVAEHQHFGHAAKACHVSQSTLSAGVVELEETLGATLVERNHRNVLLTTLGIEVVARATSILVSVDELVSVCEAAGKPFHGKMRMGVIPTIAPFLLPGLLTRLREEHPEFMLYIREDLSEHLVHALQAGELDVLLLALPFAADNVDVMPLMNDPFYLASRPDHPLAKRPHLKTRDLDGEDVLLLEDGHCLRDHALEACRLRESQISVPYQATSLSTIVQMVANGIGVTLLPKMAIDTGITSGTDLVVRPFEQADVQRNIGLMWRKKTPRQHEFRLLGEFMQGCQKT
ncbi:MAG: hydrogen peroxide-inducible genes activator [Halieaceae bacterium]|jgi:LysR family hydrogen peroxide-inducible transcriptional activator|nr:hydrogen peroxide-inducible genes activator [Halieaceae bacterium]